VDTRPEDIGTPPERLKWFVPLIIGSAQFMQTLSSTVLVNALPAMARAFEVEPLRLNLAITSYLLAFACALPASGWLADKLGAKRIFLVAIAIFALSSAAGGLAGSLWELVAARVVQGIGASMMMPVGRLVILRSTPKSQLIGAMAVLTIPAMFGPMLGPLVGGFIVTYWDWRWIFFINLPIAGAGILLIARFVPNVTARHRDAFDWVGVALLAGAMSGFIGGFELLSRNRIPYAIVAAAFLGAGLCVSLYRRHARRIPHVILDLAIFRIPTFFTAVAGASISRMCFSAMPFVLAMLLQVGFGMSALAAGFLTFMSGVGSLTTRAVAPPMLRKFGFRRLLLINGMVVSAIIVCIGFIRPQTPRWLIMCILLAFGFFRSLQNSSFVGLTYSDIDDERMSRATTTSSMFTQLNQSMGVGIAASLLHLLMMLGGHSRLTPASIYPVFWIMGALTLISLYFVLRLRRDAGAALSGVSV
jgi:EmrB/QacA subfamily drug resistance transporter